MIELPWMKTIEIKFVPKHNNNAETTPNNEITVTQEVRRMILQLQAE